MAMRKSRQRDLILDILRGTKSHPTADWIHQEARKSLPKISLGTVYRNLKLLSENAEILELHYGDGQSRFDGTVENHYHFTCQRCERVYDVEEPLRRDMERDIAKKLGFTITHHRVEFYGVCRECQEEVSLSEKNRKKRDALKKADGGRWRQMMKSVICPVCGAKVMLSFNAKDGDIVTCQKCGARLRLIADGNGFRAATA